MQCTEHLRSLLTLLNINCILAAFTYGVHDIRGAERSDARCSGGRSHGDVSVIPRKLNIITECVVMINYL